MLTVAELIQKAKPQIAKRNVNFPDGTKNEILVKGLTAGEASKEIEYMQSLTDDKGEFIGSNTQKFYAHCVSNRIVDENGNRVLTQAQCEEFDAKVLEALFKAAYEDVGAKNSPKK